MFNKLEGRKGNNFAPKTIAKRAEASTVTRRFVEFVVKK